MSKKRFNNANPTMNEAIGAADQDPLLAHRLQAQERIRAKADADRNERIRRARELAEGQGSGGDAA